MNSWPERYQDFDKEFRVLVSMPPTDLRQACLQTASGCLQQLHTPDMDRVSGRPAKRAKLLSDDESSSSEDDGGVPVLNGNGALKVNEEYAKRFEHNKKREELHRLEEKYKRQGAAGESDSDSTSEDEDDAGELVTADLDNEIEATLKALKSKDPRIYNKNASFFQPIEEETTTAEKKDKPLYLKDYHRQNLLNGVNGDGDSEAPAAHSTYADEQDALKKKMVEQMHAAADGASDQSDSDDDGFLKQKAKAAHDDIQVHPSRRKGIKDLNVEEADRDPETFLSNFMAARAWVPDENSRFAHLDSDDSEEERKAEEFEEAYNLRFEDPETANAKLTSYGRDTAAYSVRREEKTGRQKQREREREIKDAARREKQEEKNRLKKLRVEEVERKVQQIKEAAGLGPSDVVNLDEWRNVLEGDFDDRQWQEEIERRFGDKYYAEEDDLSMSEGEDDADRKRSKKHKKPKWDDDIDIKDLVPDFEDDGNDEPAFSLTDDEESGDGNDTTMPDAAAPTPSTSSSTKPTKPKSRKELQQERKSAARKQRLAIETLVDSELTTSLPPSLSAPSRAGPSLFRYRETSPTGFGLTARDILFADDSQLNTFAGLKKTHAFRDEAKKMRDKKKLGKRARLREWRRDTFGDEEGYGGTFADFVKGKVEEGGEEGGDGRGVNGRRDGGERSGKRKYGGEGQAKAAKFEPTGANAEIVESKVVENEGPRGSSGKRKRKRKHKGKTDKSEIVET